MNRTRFLLIAAGLALAPASPAGAGVSVGDVFPPIASAQAAGRMLPATPGKVLLVDFWASWCAPCKASFPAFARLNAEYAGKGLVIVAVSVDEKTSAYEAFVRKFAPPFTVALDKDHDLVRAVQVPTMPTSYLVDRSGKVRFMHPRFHGDQTEREIRREVEALLDEKSVTP